MASEDKTGIFLVHYLQHLLLITFPLYRRNDDPKYDACETQTAVTESLQSGKDVSTMISI